MKRLLKVVKWFAILSVAFVLYVSALRFFYPGFGSTVCTVSDIDAALRGAKSH